MSKILQVTNAFPTEKYNIFGIFIKDQLDGLKSIGIEFDIFFINAKEKGKREYYKAFKQLKKVVNEYDLIHCHHFLSAYVVLKCRPKGKVLVSFLSDGPNEFMLPKNFLSKAIIAKMYQFIINNSDGRIFKKQIPIELQKDPNSYYVPNGVDLDFFYPIDKDLAKKQLNLDDNKKYILFVSSQDLYRPEKRYDIFLETINILQKTYPEIEALPVCSVPRDTLPFYYNACEIHLLTSDFEGSPNSVKESLACNIPVVSNNVGNVEDMINGIENCYVTSDNNPETFANCCTELIKTKNNVYLPDFLLQNKLDRNSSLKKIEDIYSKLIND